MRRCLGCMKEYAENAENKCPYCGYTEDGRIKPGGVLQPGSILKGRFIVGKTVDIRDTDVSYVAWDALFDRRVLINEYFPKEYCVRQAGELQVSILSAKAQEYVDGVKAYYNFSKQMIRLYKEPDVQVFYGSFAENQTVYAVTQYEEFPTLKDRLNGGRLSDMMALRYLGMAAEAVKKVNDLGIAHGHIDTDAFWITQEDRLILKGFGNFGIAEQADARLRLDILGLGKIYYEMLSGMEYDKDALRYVEAGKVSSSSKTINDFRRIFTGDIADINMFITDVLETSVGRTVTIDSSSPNAAFFQEEPFMEAPIASEPSLGEAQYAPLSSGMGGGRRRGGTGGGRPGNRPEMDPKNLIIAGCGVVIGVLALLLAVFGMKSCRSEKEAKDESAVESSQEDKESDAKVSAIESAVDEGIKKLLPGETEEKAEEFRDETTAAETTAAETTAAETTAAVKETKAVETTAAVKETKAAETTAAVKETKAAETTAAVKETKAVVKETKTLVKETKAPETKAPVKETKAPETTAPETVAATKAPEAKVAETIAAETLPAPSEAEKPTVAPTEATVQNGPVANQETEAPVTPGDANSGSSDSVPPLNAEA